MSARNELQTGPLSAILLAALLGTIAFAANAEAAIPKDIVDPDNGTTLGSIDFPAISGSSAEGLVFQMSGFTEADITSVSWSLDPATLQILSLDLRALRGDDPCSSANAPCSNDTLRLRPEAAELGGTSCGVDSCFGSVSFRPIEFTDTGPIDDDADGVPNEVDNCPAIANPNQTDTDGDGEGDACDVDDDNDDVADGEDNCPLDPNPDQADTDGDGAGDLCDSDLDNDGVQDDADLCVPTAVGEVVNGEGCSVNDLCPCENEWRNHGAYMRCVAQTAGDFVAEGLLTEAAKGALVSQAAGSQCGK
jgi:hypothetical protein